MDQNKKIFSARQIQRADQVRKLHVKIGQPGVQHFNFTLDENQIINCLHTSMYAKVADVTHGKCLSTIRGRKIK